jgi:hypothetical protein
MNKKPIYTDFLNAQWKPAPMFYGFKPNVRPYILPHNRGKLPMPKSGHIQFGRVAATDNADFNPLPNKPELQLPGKIFYTQPIPQQKFLNAATVKLINSGKVKPQFRSDQKVNPLSMPIISKIADNNLKLISLEMVKNSIIGLKYDPTLGTEQQQLQARSSYDNLMVCYSSLVNNDQASPINVQKIITQYEKEMVAIYGPGIKKPVATDLLNEALAKINELDATLAKLYETVKTNGGVLVEPGDFGEVPEEEGEVKAPDIGIVNGDLPPPYEEKEAEADALVVKPVKAIPTTYNIIKQYSKPKSRPNFIGDEYNDEQQPFNDLLNFMNTNWVRKDNKYAEVIRNISSKLLSISNGYDIINNTGKPEQKIPPIGVLNIKETREDILNELMKIYAVVIQNRALTKIEVAKAKAGPPTAPPSPKGAPTPPKAPTAPPSPKGSPTPPKAPTAPPSPQGAPPKAPTAPPKPPKAQASFEDPGVIAETLVKLQNNKYKGDLIDEFMKTKDPIKTLNDFFDYIEKENKKNKSTKLTLKRTWQNINGASVRIENKDLSPANNITDPEYSFAEIDKTILKVKTAAILLLDKLIKQQAPQAAPGRKRKSRKRPAIKSVKKLSADVNNQILRLLRS